jgi:hypothetical protein
MLREVRIIRTNASESQGLAIGYAILAVAGMAAGGVKVLMSICGLGVKICGERVVLLSDNDIKEVHLFMGNLGGKLDGSVEGIDMISKLV